MAFVSGVALALRSLRKSPAFSIVALVVLAGGIAISTAAFSVVHTLIRQPLPFPGADRLAVLFERNTRLGLTEGASYAAAVDWQQHAHAFELLAALRPDAFHLTAAGEPESVAGARISPHGRDCRRLSPGCVHWRGGDLLCRGLVPRELRSVWRRGLPG